MGITENAGLSASDWVAKVGVHDSTSVLGFDSADVITNLINASTTAPSVRNIANLDVSRISGSLYVGTATAAQISGTFTPTADGDYFFAGFGTGKLFLSAELDGTRRATFGLLNVTNQEYGGVVRVAGANTYSGGTTLLAGELYLENSTTGSPGEVTSGPLGTGTLTVDPSAPSITLGFGASAAVFSNAVTVDRGELVLKSDNASGVELSGPITGTGSIRYESANALTLSNNANTFSGGLSIQSGVVIATADNALGSGTVSFDADTRLELTTSAPVIGGLSGVFPSEGTAAVISLIDGATLTLNGNSGGVYYGTIVGGDSHGIRVIKSGSSWQYFNNDNSYTGGTEITGGKLIAGSNQALGSGGVSINGGSLVVSSSTAISNVISFGGSGGNLAGVGTVNSAVTIGANATVTPGSFRTTTTTTVGTLTFGDNLTFEAGGSFDVQIQQASGTAGVGYDHLAVTGSLAFNATIGAPFTLNLLSLNGQDISGSVADFDASTVYSWTIATASGGITGFDSSVITLNGSGFLNSLNGGVFSVSLSGDTNSLLLNYTPSSVPEPSTWAMMIAGLAVVGAAARRRRRR